MSPIMQCLFVPDAPCSLCWVHVCGSWLLRDGEVIPRLRSDALHKCPFHPSQQISEVLDPLPIPEMGKLRLWEVEDPDKATSKRLSQAPIQVSLAAFVATWHCGNQAV